MKANELNEKVWFGKMTIRYIVRITDENLIRGKWGQNGFYYDDKEVEAWQKSFVGAFLSKHPLRTSVLFLIKEVLGHYPDWGDFTKLNIGKITEHLNQKCSKSSARTYAAMLKALLNDWNEEVVIPSLNYQKALSLKNEASMNIFLNEDEIKQLSICETRNETERVILAQFLCACYTGARHSDIMNMTHANIQDEYIRYVSIKTKAAVTVPCYKTVPTLIRIAQRKTYSDVTFNKVLRKLCAKAGLTRLVKVHKAGVSQEGELWKFVSSHTARRSFASNLILRGADIYSVSKMMGHAQSEMTMRYICVGLKPQNPEVMNFFK